MEVYTGDGLMNLFEDRHPGEYKKRFLYEELKDFILDEKDFRVCCLYGLRRTGKTIMMAQMLQRLGKWDNSMYILCDEGESLGSIRKEIDKVDVKYIFIDEITKTYDFINTCSVLSDSYAMSGKKIVMAGTDSLGFQISKYDELFDRVKLIHTTYIPYKEYNYLIGKGIDYYISYGGLLISEDEERYNNDILKEYTDGAIAKNILHSLEKWKRGNNNVLTRLKKMYDETDFISIIHKVIDRENRDFLVSTVNNNFSAEEFGSFYDLMVKHPVQGIDESTIDKKEFIDKFRVMLGVREPLTVMYDEYSVGLIRDYLVDLDMLYRVKGSDEYVIIQPGIRHYHTMVLIDALFNEFIDAPVTAKKEMENKLITAVCGHILEDMIYVDIIKSAENDKNIVVEKYSEDRIGREFDVTIYDISLKKAVAIEVKHSSVKDKHQTRHLKDEEFCSEFEQKNGVEIAAKLLIYNGEDDYVDGIHYINAGEFLCDIEGYLYELFGIKLGQGINGNHMLQDDRGI